MSATTKAESGGAARPSAEEFARLTEPFRPELLAHCYRMLGSVHDAEDQVQETLLRAWRYFGQLREGASLRTWLYRIATNACLRAIETRHRWPLPAGLGRPGENPEGPLAAATPEVPWLQPIPDALMRPESADPASVATSRTNIRLALIAALQYLPPRQRAVLILRDVLGWRAAEVAELLGTTTAAVNSALQRARARLRQVAPREDELRQPADPGDLALLNRYAAAFENADVTALMELLRDDAVFEMPPMLTRFTGRERIGRFLGTRVLGRPGDFKMVPIAANSQRGFACYLLGRDGHHHAHAVHVLTPGGAGIARIVSFNQAEVFSVFGLLPEPRESGQLPATSLRSAMRRSYALTSPCHRLNSA